MLEILNNIKDIYNDMSITNITILSVLFMVFLLSIYEFLVYKYVSNKGIYNRSLNISICILPFFISTIILCLQSNIVITLGTIGALAIIRFRTAIKNPIDMIYILWSIHTGIICGCQLYQVAILTSLAVTLILVVMENVKIGKLPFLLIINSENIKEEEIKKILNKYTKKYHIKTRNYSSNGIDYIIEIRLPSNNELFEELKNNKKIDKFSIIEYDSDDFI